MLGWDVLVFREGADSLKDSALIRWDTGVFGLDWLDDLVKANKAVDLGGNGYPNRYSVTAATLLPILANGLPRNHSPLVIGEDYSLPPGWNGQLKIEPAALGCSPGDILVIEAWDQS
ncbi:hypothetical protein [Cognatiluteimonas telluris]|jgi:hypothetical protein|uniref:hypothetical protein n=1 Tax=Cognatiluteimonas telluris TaxID=1104775 RepID=UPI00140CB182|nr:hypothetical protein [Lysobacter telluris]